ncbi:VOC family protein [Burkholderia cepacia]|uniref:VOC family protein n=1 Tax=Burkholderia cepacia TaxID=292 RepID=UPI001CF3918C|nr:VOC family protein [Burkholderia cepacia]MCA8399013.1 VOC family protein [Burkholderia cepacia]
MGMEVEPCECISGRVPAADQSPQKIVAECYDEKPVGVPDTFGPDQFQRLAMKLRTVYLKVIDMETSVSFWRRLLGHEPHKQSGKWTEFMIGENRLGLLLNDFGDEFNGSGSVPVFEFEEEALHEFVQRALENGASVVMDGLKIESMKSIVLSSPDGHEFELCMCHA